MTVIFATYQLGITNLLAKHLYRTTSALLTAVGFSANKMSWSMAAALICLCSEQKLNQQRLFQTCVWCDEGLKDFNRFSYFLYNKGFSSAFRQIVFKFIFNPAYFYYVTYVAATLRTSFWELGTISPRQVRAPTCTLTGEVQRSASWFCRQEQRREPSRWLERPSGL